MMMMDHSNLVQSSNYLLSACFVPGMAPIVVLQASSLLTLTIAPGGRYPWHSGVLTAKVNEAPAPIDRN